MPDYSINIGPQSANASAHAFAQALGGGGSSSSVPALLQALFSGGGGGGSGINNEQALINQLMFGHTGSGMDPTGRFPVTPYAYPYWGLPANIKLPDASHWSTGMLNSAPGQGGGDGNTGGMHGGASGYDTGPRGGDMFGPPTPNSQGPWISGGGSGQTDSPGPWADTHPINDGAGASGIGPWIDTSKLGTPGSLGGPQIAYSPDGNSFTFPGGGFYNPGIGNIENFGDPYSGGGSLYNQPDTGWTVGDPWKGKANDPYADMRAGPGYVPPSYTRLGPMAEWGLNPDIGSGTSPPGWPG